MTSDFTREKPIRLFIVLGGIFIANAIVAEVLGVKIFSLEGTLGWPKADFTLFGQAGLSFDLSVGVLPWPVVFVMTDIINEYYGVRGVKLLSLLAAALIAFMFGVFYLAIHTAPADWWVVSQAQHGVPSMQAAYHQVLGQGMSIIVASLTAFLIGQLADATLFKHIKIITGGRRIWMRATLSTLVSQLIDTVVVSYLYLYFSMGFPFARVTAVALVGYAYKFSVAILCTPLIYLAHRLITLYLGAEQTEAMKQNALQRTSLFYTD
jgi:uncharacterized integral membrane protein (TIGR00697 family)